MLCCLPSSPGAAGPVHAAGLGEVCCYLGCSFPFYPFHPFSSPFPPARHNRSRPARRPVTARAGREKGWGEKTELITVPSSPHFSSILDGTRGGTARCSVPKQAQGERGCFQPALRTRADRYLPTGKGESRWRKKAFRFPA